MDSTWKVQGIGPQPLGYPKAVREEANPEEEKANSVRETEKQNKPQLDKERLSEELEKRLQENLAKYRDAGLINHEEMKVLLSIMVPHTGANKEPEDELEKIRSGKNHVNEIA